MGTLKKETDDMKPTISNAFNENPANVVDSGVSETPAGGAAGRAWDLRKPDPAAGKKRNPRKSLAASLASMQVDLRESDFGWSLELSPMRAIDALDGLNPGHVEQTSLRFLVSMEQSAWRSGSSNTSIAEIADRLAISTLDRFGSDQLVLDELSMRQLVSLCQPTRLIVVVGDGPIDERDAGAINRAIDAGKSPLLAELRAITALEVLGDRSVVLHCRDRAQALGLVSQNFRHYLAALRDRPMAQFGAPEPWQVERLLDNTGMLTVRPIETQVFSTSVDVGVNTTRERFTQPADRSLVYDLPSDTWHDEP
jgi:hypothetical protein